VPSAVYITIAAVRRAGMLSTYLIATPSQIRRSDGRPIAIFKSLSGTEGLAALPRSVCSR
jgi:hypothetical protein